MVDTVANQLSQAELFSALYREELDAVAALAAERRYPRGDMVFWQGESGSAYYLVESGELRLLHVDPTGVEHEVGRLGPGDSLGESSLLLGEPHDATAQVVEDAQLLIINRDDFDHLLSRWPAIAQHLQMSREVERRRRAPRFDWQEPDETTIFVLHKHDVVLVQRLLFPATALILILVGYFFVGSTAILGLVLGGLLSAVPLLVALYHIVDHFNDNYILTNRRVMHDEHVYLIRRSRVGAPLSNIQSIQQVQEGLLARSFGFGDLIIETAGEPGGTVTFRAIPNPRAVQKQVFQQRERVEAQARAEERVAIQDALHRRLGSGQTRREPAGGPPAQEPSGEEGEGTWPSWALAPVRAIRYFFPALRYEEGDTITWRKHWVALLGPISRPTAVIGLVTLVVAWLLARDTDQAAVLLTYGILLLFLVPWWLWVFEDWQNDVYQVTSSRIVDIEQIPFGLREDRREAGLGMIQNVNLRIPGAIGRILGYGSVTIETAGAGAFTFDYVSHPEDVQSEIFRRMEDFARREREQRAQRRRDELLDWFTVYDEMRHAGTERRDAHLLSPSARSHRASDSNRQARSEEK